MVWLKGQCVVATNRSKTERGREFLGPALFPGGVFSVKLGSA